MRGRVSARRTGLRVLVALMTVCLVALTGCAPAETDDADAARAITTEESELLAIMRFRNFDAGTRSVSFEVDDRGAKLAFEGWFDYASGVGYGALSEEGTPNSLLAWNTDVVGVHEPTAEGAAPLPIPDADALATAWTGGALDPASSRLHATLAVIGSLGVDRPDNPLLLRQGGALYLGREEVGAIETTVFAGPLSDRALPAGQTIDPEAATTRYWVDAEGMLRRAATRLGGSGGWTTIQLGDADGVALGDPFAGTGAAP